MELGSGFQFIEVIGISQLAKPFIWDMLKDQGVCESQSWLIRNAPYCIYIIKKLFSWINCRDSFSIALRVAPLRAVFNSEANLDLVCSWQRVK